MADGYARLSGRPQCVIVHVDVGTQGLGAAVHNASCGRAPVLIFAGLSPYTCDGEYRGSRTEYIHWIQDVPDQKQIVSQYCRYSGEIKGGRNVKQMVGRALQFATSAPAGPSYLVGPREVMEEDIEPYELQQAHWAPLGNAALPEDAVQKIAEALVGAKEPLLITGYCGRIQEAVGHLVTLAETVKGLRILDTGGSDMCFPQDHRASLGLRYGIHDHISTADVIIVADCDVPWIPTQCKPATGTRIFHIDSDPLKQQMPVFYIPAEARYKVTTSTAFRQLHTYISSSPTLSQTCSEPTYQSRWGALKREHAERVSIIRSLAQPSQDGTTFNASYLISRLKHYIPADTVFAIEAVTLTGFVADQLLPSIPGTWFNCGGGGLGWSGGAALGLKLAAGEKRFVCQIVGDGTFLFSVPGSVYWISQRYNLPVLTIVLNNQGWNAPKRSLLLVHPEGEASKASNEDLNISFAPSPDYAGLAKCAAGGNLWAGSAGTVDELEHKMQEAVESVKGGVGAVLDAHLDGPQGKYGGGKSVTIG
ncbi:MAG: hypothetical protein Q9207_004345 [Kuettlingeria erythrocarpa]